MMRTKILVVDDDPIIRMDIKEMLEEEGYHVVGEAKDGEIAVEMAFKHEPDLIIMDVKMPKMNGIKASEIIRKKLDCAVLLLTAYSQRDLIQDARKAGVAAYLVKPVTERNLFPSVEMAVGQKQRMDALKGNISELQHNLEARKAIEIAKGRLMQIRSMSEDEAYRWMRKQSMTERIPIEKLARRLLDEEFATDCSGRLNE
ncbi:ANTAR domain-containing response regulator [Ferviditalea candida]|uniref:Response regulator n=1 Tax=Ferviditalea candida TaxID=3108399 RepID=A0ABU5ZIB0_9BACL|nr:response regulator [Paenibacillaceae bacterium T2]